jgi:iron complex outermembrane receptor protein
VNDKLRTSAAVRYDDFDIKPDGSSNISPLFPAGANPFIADDYEQHLEAVNYNIGAVYQASDVDTLRVSIARGVDLPSFTEFGLQFLSAPNATNPVGLATLGDPRIKSGITENFELGYDRKIDAINGDFRGSVFYQRNDEMQGFSASFNTTPNFFGAGLNLDRAFVSNIGDSDMYGFELGLKGVAHDRWLWGANYTMVRIDDDLRNQQNAGDFSSNAEYEDGNSVHTLNLHLGYTADDWHADVFGQYVSAWEGLEGVVGANNQFDSKKIDAQFIVNANFAYDLSDHLTWSVSGTGITGPSDQAAQGGAETVIWSGLRYKF